jgi:hypothetical protein
LPRFLRAAKKRSEEVKQRSEAKKRVFAMRKCSELEIEDFKSEENNQKIEKSFFSINKNVVF